MPERDEETESKHRAARRVSLQRSVASFLASGEVELRFGALAAVEPVYLRLVEWATSRGNPLPKVSEMIEILADAGHPPRMVGRARFISGIAVQRKKKT